MCVISEHGLGTSCLTSLGNEGRLPGGKDTFKPKFLDDQNAYQGLQDST